MTEYDENLVSSHKGRNLILTGVVGTIILMTGLGLIEINEPYRIERNALKSKLEQFVQQDSNPSINPQEKMRMYEACGVKDTTKYLTRGSLKKGIKYIKSH